MKNKAHCWNEDLQRNRSKGGALGTATICGEAGAITRPFQDLLKSHQLYPLPGIIKSYICKGSYRISVPIYLLTQENSPLVTSVSDDLAFVSVPLESGNSLHPRQPIQLWEDRCERVLFPFFKWSQSLHPCNFLVLPSTARGRKKAGPGYRLSFLKGNWSLSIKLFPKTSVSNHCVGEWMFWAKQTSANFSLGLTPWWAST